MSGMALSATPITAESSQDVRERLVTTLELELIGPTQRVLETLGPAVMSRPQVVSSTSQQLTQTSRLRHQAPRGLTTAAPCCSAIWSPKKGCRDPGAVFQRFRGPSGWRLERRPQESAAASPRAGDAFRTQNQTGWISHNANANSYARREVPLRGGRSRRRIGRSIRSWSSPARARCTALSDRNVYGHSAELDGLRSQVEAEGLEGS